MIEIGSIVFALLTVKILKVHTAQHVLISSCQKNRARLNAIVLIENDEFGHRQYPCDLQRTFNIVQALGQTVGFKDMPILYLRFNPHTYHRNYFIHPLEIGHGVILSTLKNIITQTRAKFRVHTL